MIIPQSSTSTRRDRLNRLMNRWSNAAMINNDNVAEWNSMTRSENDTLCHERWQCPA